MNSLDSILVFCASSDGHDPIWMKKARELGVYFANNRIRLVYGGGRVGLMGAIADGALSKNGEVVGVIPSFLNSKEIGHRDVTELIVVETMHERKKKMHDISDGIIALPGGYGTLEELFEVITWAQLGLHSKPVGLLNINGYYDHLITFIKQMVDTGLLKRENEEMLLVANNLEELLTLMKNYDAPAIPKWLEKDEV